MRLYLSIRSQSLAVPVEHFLPDWLFTKFIFHCPLLLFSLGIGVVSVLLLSFIFSDCDCAWFADTRQSLMSVTAFPPQVLSKRMGRELEKRKAFTIHVTTFFRFSLFLSPHFSFCHSLPHFSPFSFLLSPLPPFLFNTTH